MTVRAAFCENRGPAGALHIGPIKYLLDRDILGGNAVKLFKLDLGADKLAKVA